MSLTKTVGLFAGTTLALTGAAFGSIEANNNDALSQIAELKAEIQTLKAQSGDNWLSEQRATEIKGLVQDVLADADTRASLQGAGSTAGWDNGFFLASADGNFRLNVSGGAQIRWTYNNRSLDDNNPVNAGQTENNWGFASRYASLTFAGHIVDPSWQYLISMSFFDDSGDYDGETGGGGSAYLNDWYVLKDFGGFYLRAGQFVAPFSRERMMGDYDLQMLSRSNTSYAFGLGRTQGIELGFISDMFRVAASINNGMGQNSPTQNRGFNPNAGNSPGTDFAVSGRAEIKLAGNWKQFEYQQGWRGEEFGLLIGGGVYYQNGRTGGLATPGFITAANGGTNLGTGGDSYGFTVDAAAQFGGFNALAAFYWEVQNSTWFTGVDNLGQFNGKGLMVQGGFFLTDELELVARYEYGDFSNLSTLAPPVNGNLQSVATIGVNWYFAKNRAKWQTDFSYAFNTMGIFGDYGAGNGWYVDGVDGNGNQENGQMVFRTGITVNF